MAYHHNRQPQESHRIKPFFSVVWSLIRHCKRGAIEYLGSNSKIKPVLIEILQPLCLVPRVFHVIIIRIIMHIATVACVVVTNGVAVGRLVEEEVLSNGAENIGSRFKLITGMDRV